MTDEPVKPATNRDANGRFLPGAPSANPKGRPRTKDSLTALLRDALDRIDPNDRAGRTNAEIMTEVLLMLAKGGESWAVREVFDRCEGKAVQKTEITGADSGPVRMIVNLAGDIEDE